MDETLLELVKVMKKAAALTEDPIEKLSIPVKPISNTA